jgi:hypothetical protein
MKFFASFVHKRSACSFFQKRTKKLLSIKVLRRMGAGGGMAGL